MMYFDELTKAMTWLGQQPDTVFLGQSVAYPGNALFKTLVGVPAEKKLEMPVAEDMQLGLSIGMALAGKVPVSIFPRMDFLMCCMNQLVNHLDKMPDVRVIVRTSVGATKPMHPGSQHCGDYTEGLTKMLKNVRVITLKDPNEIVRAYMYAYGKLKDRACPEWRSTILVEYGDLYD